MNNIIITAPSLDPTQNVSGVSSVAQFIIENNAERKYLHFQLGKSDHETGLWNRVLRIYRSYREWKRMLDEYPDALIHYSFPLSAPSILRDPMFMSYALRKNRKMVVHVHGGLFLTAPKIPYILRWILEWVFSWDVPFIVLSDGEKEILKTRWGVKEVEVLPNCPNLNNVPQISQIGTEGIDDNDNGPQISQIGTDECHSLSTYNTEIKVGKVLKQRLVLGYLGRIEPNKGMSELLEACKVLKANGVDFLLRFAGKEETEGEYLPVYKEALGDSFEYVGLVSGKSKDDFLRSLDVFVMPTYFEGLPMSLLECMGYGVVPVVTNVGSISTVVKPLINMGNNDSANGVFVKVKDIDSIVDAISFLDSNRQCLKMFGINAQKMIEENFSAKNYVEKLNRIYESL